MTATSDSLAMTSAMMEAGMNIDRNSLANMYHTISSFPGHDPVNIIQMHQMGLEINEQSVEQFEAFKNYETQIGEGMKQIAADIPQMYGELVAAGKEDAAMQFMKAVVDTFLGTANAELTTGNAPNGEAAIGSVLQDGALWQEISQEAEPQNSLQAVVVDGKVVGSAPLPADGFVMTKEVVPADDAQTLNEIKNVLSEQEAPEAAKELSAEGKAQTQEVGKGTYRGEKGADSGSGKDTCIRQGSCRAEYIGTDEGYASWDAERIRCAGGTAFKACRTAGISAGIVKDDFGADEADGKRHDAGGACGKVKTRYQKCIFI